MREKERERENERERGREREGSRKISIMKNETDTVFSEK